MPIGITTINSLITYLKSFLYKAFSLVKRYKKKLLINFNISLWKRSSKARNEAILVNISKTNPGSFKLIISWNKTRCPLDEIGKISVIPWTIPNNIYFKISHIVYHLA